MSGQLEMAPPPAQPSQSGQAMHALIARLYPICRSITGDGVRETLRIIGERIPLEIHEVPTGTEVFDWRVPKEWNVRDAWIKDPSGRKVVDFSRSSLSVVNYSLPVRARMTLEELRPHLFTLPEQPDWTPYRTSYYHETWGFCLPHKELLALEAGEYEVLIDAELAPGHLTYGELLVPGETSDEILLSTHICHPALCNDGLSGLALYSELAQQLQQKSSRYSYRFLFIPGTIGSITWLARNEAGLERIKHGLVVSCIGDAGQPTYKKSRRGDAVIDRAVAQVLRHRAGGHEIRDFFPYGYDERQFCSPGFNLPVGALARTPHGCFPEYHTSADDLDLVKPEKLQDSLALIQAVLSVLEHDRRYLNTNPKCEPQLGRRGLYATLGGRTDAKTAELAMLWVLNLSDGEHSLLEIAERSDVPFEQIQSAAAALIDADLLRPCDGGPGMGAAS